MENKSSKNSKNKNYLIIALASLIAVSTMAASVMSGCGENSEQTSETKIIHETQIVTRIENSEVTETYYIDADGNIVEPNENSNSDNSTTESKSENSSKTDGASSDNKTDSSSSGAQSNSSSKTSSAGSSSSKKPASNSSSSSAQKPKSSASSSNSGGSTSSKVCTVDGTKFNVGDKITCTYNLKTPDVLENFQATIKYNSDCLKVTSAKLMGEAKGGSLLNFKLNGKINFNGSNISSGYDYTKGGDFLTVTYEVIGGGTVNTKFEWVAACKLGDTNKNYISKDGTPDKGIKLTSNYTKAE